jgi:hypothetical protein
LGKADKSPKKDTAEPGFLRICVPDRHSIYSALPAIEKEGVMAKLFIGNIPHAATEVERQQWVESRGFGFVTFAEEVDIQSAIGVLNGRRMNRRVLTVNEATPLTATSSYSGNHRSDLRSNPPVQDCKP